MPTVLSRLADRWRRQRTALPAGRSTVVTALLLATIVTAGAWFRVEDLGRPGLWLDEILTYRHAAGMPWATAWQPGPSVEHGPAFHVPVALSLSVVDSDASARFPSALAGIAAIPLAFDVAATMVSPAAGLMAAALVAASPRHVYQSREARPYVLLMTGWLALMSAGLRLGGRRRSAWLTCAAAVLLPLVSAQGIWYLATAGVTLAGWQFAGGPTGRWRRLGILCGALALGAATFALIYWPILGHSTDVVGSQSISRELLERLAASLVTGLPEDVQPRPEIGGWLLFLGVCAALLVVTRRLGGAVLVIGALVAFVLPIETLALADRGIRGRYLVVALMPWILVAAGGLAGALERVLVHVWRSDAIRRHAALLVSAVLGMAAIVQQADARRDAMLQRADWREVALQLKDRAEPGDLVIASNAWAAICLGYHLPRAGVDLDVRNAEESIAQAEAWLAGRDVAFLTSAGWHRDSSIVTWMDRFPEVLSRRQERIRVELFPDASVALRLRPSRRDVDRLARALGSQLAGVLIPGGSVDSYLTAGWGAVEQDGRGVPFRWVVGHEATVFVPVIDGPPATLSLTWEAFGATGAGQRATLLVNDIRVADVPVPARLTSIDVPLGGVPGAWQRGANVLTLRFADARRPSDGIPGSADQRLLAARVTSLRLR